jgi:flagellar protein FliO/FliZ
MSKRFFALLLFLLPPLFCWAAEPAAPAPPPGLLSGGLRALGGLVLVVGLMLLIYALYKRRGGLLPGNRSNLVKVVETRHLGPKKALALVEVRGEELLIGIGSDQINLICRLAGRSAESFDQALQQQMDRHP